MRAARERFESAAERTTPRRLALLMFVIAAVWVGLARVLDKTWLEVALDALPYVLVGIALLRTRPALRAVAERMKGYEREMGFDPDDLTGDGGPTAIAL
ncbi:MAG: hypothetical protein ABR575_05770 [Actinomycetota bacterium]